MNKTPHSTLLAFGMSFVMLVSCGKTEEAKPEPPKAPETAVQPAPAPAQPVAPPAENLPNAEALAGTYEWRKGDAYGYVLVYPTGGNTFIVHLDLSNGSNYGDIDAKCTLGGNGEATVLNTEYGTCELKLTFTEKSLKIEEKGEECGFGAGVSAAGTYKRTSSKKPEYYENMEGERVMFKDMKL